MENPAEAVNKRSVVLAGHRTSISLEAEFWQALREVARIRRLSVNALVAAIDADAARAGRSICRAPCASSSSIVTAPASCRPSGRNSG